MINILMDGFSFLFKVVYLIKVGPKFMQEKNSYFRFSMFLQCALINDQWNAFLSSIRVNYVRVNFVCAEEYTA